ncbi:MAG TPA: RsmE family RNA methyltransferase [Phycisphaerales bacterium]|nr:RsmE family RNA methyltransferase [Phycisphaerales bacterium]
MGHRVYFPSLETVESGLITVTGEEAHHALRVKRLAVGDAIDVLDGQGRVARTRIATTDKTRDGWAMGLEVGSLDRVTQVAPLVTVAAAVPKGERLEWIIDGLSQVGAAAWRPLSTRRSVVDPREGKLERLHRVAIEAMKQCGRAHVLQLLPIASLAESLKTGRVVIADASGGEYQPTGADAITLLIGPEGGWEPAELEAAAGAGAIIARFGPHVMRTEMAAVVACAEVLSVEKRSRARAV